MTESPSFTSDLSADILAVKRDLAEIKDRARRMETRITSYLGDQGFDILNTKPKWEGQSTLMIPSLNMGVGDLIKALAVRPTDYVSDAVRVVHKGTTVLTFRPL